MKMCINNNRFRTCLSIGCLKSSASRLLKTTGDVPTARIISLLYFIEFLVLLIGGYPPKICEVLRIVRIGTRCEMRRG
jgi:hypothetical protein